MCVHTHMHMFMSTVGVCVSMVSTCSCVYIYIHIYVCIHMSLHEFMGLCLYVQEYVHVYVYVCIHLSSCGYTHAHMCYICIHVCMHAFVSSYVCVHLHAHGNSPRTSYLLYWAGWGFVVGAILCSAGFLEHPCPLPTRYLWGPLTAVTTWNLCRHHWVSFKIYFWIDLHGAFLETSRRAWSRYSVSPPRPCPHHFCLFLHTSETASEPFLTIGCTVARFGHEVKPICPPISRVRQRKRIQNVLFWSTSWFTVRSTPATFTIHAPLSPV